jgi:hypothetical protein
VTLQEQFGLIHADLRIGANVAAAKALRANSGISSPGFKLHGAGFIVTPDEARCLGADAPIKVYRNGRDLTDRPRGVQLIDLFGFTAEEVRARYPATYQWVVERVKPERDQNRDLAEQLDAHRKRQQAAHPALTLTLTGMYNVLEKLRRGEALNAKDKAIHEQGLVSVLKSLHDKLGACRAASALAGDAAGAGRGSRPSARRFAAAALRGRARGALYRQGPVEETPAADRRHAGSAGPRAPAGRAGGWRRRPVRSVVIGLARLSLAAEA